MTPKPGELWWVAYKNSFGDGYVITVGERQDDGWYIVGSDVLLGEWNTVVTPLEHLPVPKSVLEAVASMDAKLT